MIVEFVSSSIPLPFLKMGIFSFQKKVLLVGACLGVPITESKMSMLLYLLPPRHLEELDNFVTDDSLQQCG
jgi:hypothetical protein